MSAGEPIDRKREVDIQKPVTGFGALDVTERTPVVELKSNYGVSALRGEQYQPRRR